MLPERGVSRTRAPNQGVPNTPRNEGHIVSQTAHLTQSAGPRTPERIMHNAPTAQTLDNLNTHHPRTAAGKTTRGTFKIGTLNIRGGASIQTDKWRHIDQLMKVNKIGALAIQETHLTEEHVASLHRDFFGGLHVLNTGDPENPSGRGGVAVVLNKRLTHWKEAKTTVISPGRAILVELPWKETTRINILAVYAPNITKTNADFWLELQDKWNENNYPQPDILLGDFNLVEETIDRLPIRRQDPISATRALANLKEALNMLDGWRQQNPNKIAFSYTQAQQATNRTPSRSRIDRIYVTEAVLKHSYEWSIEETAIQTDHKIAVMTFSNPGNAHIGKGRWVISLSALKDRKILKEVTRKGLQCLAAMEGISNETRSAHTNAQIFLSSFKRETVKYIREYTRIAIPKLKKTIDTCKKQLEHVFNEEDLPMEERMVTAAAIEARIKDLETVVHHWARDNLAARHALQGETLSSYWINSNKIKEP